MAIESKGKKGKPIPTEKRIKIAAQKLANPDLTVNELAAKNGTSKSSAARIVNDELGKVGTYEKAKTLFEMNLDIINHATSKVVDAMKTMKPEDIRQAKEMQSIVDTAFKQNQLIEGKPTHNLGMSSLKELPTEQLLALIDGQTE